MTEKDPYSEGYAAYPHGWNPYHCLDANHQEWDSGWYAAWFDQPITQSG